MLVARRDGIRQGTLAYEGDELLSIERLGQVVIAADVEAFLSVGAHRVGGDGDDGADVAFAP